MFATNASLVHTKGIDARTPFIAQEPWPRRRFCWIMTLGSMQSTKIAIPRPRNGLSANRRTWRDFVGVARKGGHFSRGRARRFGLGRKAGTRRSGLASRIGSVRLRSFPRFADRGRGGTIYRWTLRFNSSPHQIALPKGHQAIVDYLYAESDMKIRLLLNFVMACRTEASSAPFNATRKADGA
jgi:hypothetical protein